MKRHAVGISLAGEVPGASAKLVRLRIEVAEDVDDASRVIGHVDEVRDEEPTIGALGHEPCAQHPLGGDVHRDAFRNAKVERRATLECEAHVTEDYRFVTNEGSGVLLRRARRR